MLIIAGNLYVHCGGHPCRGAPSRRGIYRAYAARHKRLIPLMW
jgi:hypothetical protein